MRTLCFATTCSCLTLFVSVTCSINSIGAAELAVTGEQIYKAQCADCHGANGEGSKEYDTRKLAGGLSISQLAVQIHETMPEDDPESLSQEEAQAVAAYVHDAFYSAIARARNQPARIELARLTVRQYRQAVADLIGSFTPPAQLSDQQGLDGEYYRGRRPSGRGRVAQRIDPQVNFDFGTEAPVSEIDEPHSFSIRWTGAVQAPETGDYEFIVKTEHAARLWVNDETPLIDAWVKSGEETQYTANLFLVAGRVYPLRLEFTKAKQGVDDSKKRKKPKSAPAAIALHWQRPHGVAEPIPARFLSPSTVSEAYVCATPFPPDDRSLGWERGTAISKAWDQATTSAGIDAAAYVVERINQFANTKDDADDRTEKLKAFCRLFVERGFRRPLTERLESLYVEKQFDVAGDPDAAVKRVVLLTLKSPRFLFREVATERDAYDVAARLSFGLWDTIPDQALLDAAREGQLETKQQVAEYAEKMLQDLRAKAKLRSFLLTWLKAEAGIDLGKDPEKYPDFDAASIADLRTSLELFLDDVMWSEGADYRQLLLDDEVFLNQRLAEFYGAEPNAEDGFAKVRLDDGKRAGILTHPYVMARFAYNAETSPIHRGVFLARGVLGQSLRPPPAAVAPIAPDLHPGLTTRERVTLQTKATTCMACHSIINPLGFTLEHFDAVGRYRELDRNTPVDDSGSYKSRSGEVATLQGARALAEFVAGSEEGHAAFIEQLFHHLVQQPVKAYGINTLDELHDSFVKQDYNMRNLAVDVMTASVLVGRETNVLASATPE